MGNAVKGCIAWYLKVKLYRLQLMRPSDENAPHAGKNHIKQQGENEAGDIVNNKLKYSNNNIYYL